MKPLPTQRPLLAGLDCLPDQEDLFPTDGTEPAEDRRPSPVASVPGWMADTFAMRDLPNTTVFDRVSAADLVNHEDRIAPVSGARCRNCGKAARLDPGGTTWIVEDGTAYCATCWNER